MQPILKFGLTKSGISSTLQTAVRYGPWSLGGIGLFYSFVIQGTGTIAFLIEHYWKSTPSSPLLLANLSTLQLESGRGWIILENNYIETQNGYRQSLGYSRYRNSYPQLGPEVSTQRTHDACLMTHL